MFREDQGAALSCQPHKQDLVLLPHPNTKQNQRSFSQKPHFAAKLQSYISERTLLTLHLIKSFSTQLRGPALLEIRAELSALLRTWRCAEGSASICVTEHGLRIRNSPAKGKCTTVSSENTPKCRGGKGRSSALQSAQKKPQSAGGKGRSSAP